MTEAPPITEQSTTVNAFRCGTVTLAGRSNVGKSTLLNRVLGTKLAITSKKPQTTRSAIVGVRTAPGAQTIWMDTPGIHRARNLLNRRMVDAAQRSIAQADVVVVVIDASAGLIAQDREAIDTVVASRHPWLMAVNKIDLIGDTRMVPLLDAIGRELPELDVVPVSASRGKNLPALERAVAARLPPAPAVYPEDELTDQSERAIVQEFVREQVFAATDGEIPYKTAVLVERFEEKPGVNVVSATILVERDSHKRIIVGSGGAMIRKIGSLARQELERFFAKRFYLELFVKVRRDWTRSPRVLTELGL